MARWSIAESRKTYSIESWGHQYFDINAEGSLTVHPTRDKLRGIDLTKVIEEVRSCGLQLPVLIRFQDIIRDRVQDLNRRFQEAIEEFDYQGRYQGVYPLKVNQMREVVEEIIDAGKPFDYGLEAGSKSELAAVLAMKIQPDALVICNGYKDPGFIRLALMGNKLGKKVLIVIEKLSELDSVIEIAKEMKVKPLIGIRSKLSSKGSGNWEGSSGDHAKFGLSTPELLHAVNLLRQKELESSLKLLHFHVGSQITDIRTVKEAVREGTRIYAKLCKMGIDMEYIDVGGGLGVDYDGSRTRFESSTNYSIGEYCRDVVYSIQEICQAENVSEPTIVSESGRAVVAHHSVLITDVFGAIEKGSSPYVLEESDDEHNVVKEMRYVRANLTNKNLLEHYHDAVQRREEAETMFKLGIVSLSDKAKVETLFWQICKEIYKKTSDMKYVPDDLADLEIRLADQYLCNFSVFQSILDHWSIGHLFPVVPISRHDEEPTRRATLADITCDSDGKVDKFVDLREIKRTLPLHTLNDQPYYLGFFLVGAYQDIMGDLHNLFGRVNEVHVFLDDTEEHGYYIEEIIKGNKISRVLSWIEYSATDLSKTVKNQIDSCVREGKIKPKEGVRMHDFYEAVLDGYTYGAFENLKQSTGQSVYPGLKMSFETKEERGDQDENLQ